MYYSTHFPGKQTNKLGCFLYAPSPSRSVGSEAFHWTDVTVEVPATICHAGFPGVVRRRFVQGCGSGRVKIGAVKTFSISENWAQTGPEAAG